MAPPFVVFLQNLPPRAGVISVPPQARPSPPPHPGAPRPAPDVHPGAPRPNADTHPGAPRPVPAAAAKAADLPLGGDLVCFFFFPPPSSLPPDALR